MLHSSTIGSVSNWLDIINQSIENEYSNDVNEKYQLQFISACVFAFCVKMFCIHEDIACFFAMRSLNIAKSYSDILALVYHYPQLHAKKKKKKKYLILTSSQYSIMISTFKARATSSLMNMSSNYACGGPALQIFVTFYLNS